MLGIDISSLLILGLAGIRGLGVVLGLSEEGLLVLRWGLAWHRGLVVADVGQGWRQGWILHVIAAGVDIGGVLVWDWRGS